MHKLRAALVTDPLIVLATIVMGSLSLLVSLFDAGGRGQHQVAQWWARLLLWIAGVRMRVEGLEKIAAEGAYVFAANHESYMDIPSVVASVPVQFRFMAKRSLWKVPFIGYHLRRAGHIPVERSDTRSALRSLAEAGRVVRESGVSVLVFPEGGRSPHGLREFKEGAAYVAIKAGVPAVPLALLGTRQVLPMDSLLVRGGEVLLRIGDPIPTAGLTPRDHARLTEQLQESVREMLSGAGTLRGGR